MALRLRDADLKDKIGEAKAIGDVDFVAYQGEYEKMLKFEGADLKRLEERVDRLSARCPKGATNQPPLGEKSTKTGQYLVLGCATTWTTAAPPASERQRPQCC